MKLVDISTEAESETSALTCAGGTPDLFPFEIMGSGIFLSRERDAASSMNHLRVFMRGLRVEEKYGLNLSPRHRRQSWRLILF